MTNTLDSLGIEKALTLFSEQIKTTYTQALNSNIEILNFDKVVISGMGGSSNAGKIVQSLCERDSNIPVFVFNDYGLPNWVNENTLVVLNSYSGNTEETLSAYDVANNKNCKIIGITTGGKVGEMITNGLIKGAIVSAGETNPSNYPKSGLGLSLGAIFGALTNVGLIRTTEAEIDLALSEVVKIRENWNIKELASWVGDGFPIFFASRPFLGPMNAARNACCEIGRVFTEFYDFPEVDHVLIEAMKNPADALNNKYIFFESDLDNDRIKLRYKVTKELMTKMGLTFNSYKLLGTNFLSQSLEFAHLGAWLGFYLSEIRGEDPGPEPWIIELKNLLSQPVH